MFRRQEDALNPDPQYPANLKELGYFVDNDGIIRNIGAPEHTFDFFYTNSDRHNEVRGEAMRVCQIEEVMKRLSALGLKELYLPTLSNSKPNSPHIPILAPATEVLKTRKRVVVIINDDTFQDLGILAYRELQRERGLNGATVVNFAKELASRSRTNMDATLKEKLAKDGAGIDNDEHIPGLIVLNTGQLLYSHKFNKALSIRSWTALPRKSITHDAVMIHPVENRVEGHQTPQEHIKTAFNTVIKNPDLVSPEAEVYVIAIENGAEKLIDVLNQDFHQYSKHITALAVIHSSLSSCHIRDPEVKAFLHARARHWECSRFRGSGPSQCNGLPLDYNSKAVSRQTDYTESIDWLEVLRGGIDKRVDNPFTNDSATKPATVTKEATINYDDWQDVDPICPTFGGGDSWVGECVFTQRIVQEAVLKFFEDVARDPKGYCNPPFSLVSLDPSPANPLTLSADSALDTLPDEMLNPEQQAVLTTQAELDYLKTSYHATPHDDPELVPGLQRLQGLITSKEAELKELEKKALAGGALGAGAAPEVRDSWQNTDGEKWTEMKPGPKIDFAGVKADGDMVKSAGCLETVEEELAKLDMEED
ncbi:hypothetical protein N0V90_013016 [Kalmusia sp. IMI 367209]|nr:hypothetical protein N0V90_013016 [Kalmusia sp. IMI 367209]